MQLVPLQDLPDQFIASATFTTSSSLSYWTESSPGIRFQIEKVAAASPS
jgi:hypothetical protein